MNRSPEIWLVCDDSIDDFILLVRASALAFEFPPVLRHARDGTAAQEFLLRRDEQPSMILCDLKMPRMNGMEFLQWVRTQSSLKEVPFVVLSGSNADQDRQSAQSLGADGYLVKPAESRELVRLVKGLNQARQRVIGASLHRNP